MRHYNVHVCGTVKDTETDFRCGFDFSVENGGSVKNIGDAIQSAIDGIKHNGHQIPSSSDAPVETTQVADLAK